MNNDHVSDEENNATISTHDSEDENDGFTPASPMAMADSFHDGDDRDDNDGVEWQAFLDDEGRTYYFNESTGESQWTAPDRFKAVQDEGLHDANADADAENTSGDEVQADEEVHPQINNSADVATLDNDDSNEEMENDVTASNTVESPTAEAAAATTATTGWIAYKDDDGREYYYNHETGLTQWERPPENVDITREYDDYDDNVDPTTTAKDQQEQQQEDINESDMEQYSLSPARIQEENIPEKISKNAKLDDLKSDVNVRQEKQVADVDHVQEEEEDAVTKASKSLLEPDAILEPDCLKHLGELVTSLGGAVGGPQAIKNLVSSYQALTAECGILASWLSDLIISAPPPPLNTRVVPTSEATLSSSFSTSSSSFLSLVGKDLITTSANAVRTIAENIIGSIAKEKFSKTGGDSILRLSKAEAAFLEDMMDSERWRHLLIDLSAANKDSALLMYCLQSISKRGHHREIAKRIDQSDYFGVFNGMFASELSIIGKLAIGSNVDVLPSGTDIASSIGTDLLRTCTSTAYTYVYAIEAIEDLMKKAKSIEAEDQHRATEIFRVIRKWRKFQEDLEDSMMNPPSDGSKVGVSSSARKRRVDIALTVSDLHQRQRRKVQPILRNAYGDSKKNISSDPRQNDLECAVYALLRKHCLGMPIDIQLLDRLVKFQFYVSNAGISVGSLLVAYPTAINALLEALFTAGTTRIKSDTSIRCATLLALAAVASRQNAIAGSTHRQDLDQDAVKLMHDQVRKDVILASDLCEQVSNLVSLCVIDSDDRPTTENSSVGRRLSRVSIKCAIAAQGVIMWATEQASGREFQASAAYPTLAPGILGLARIIATHHPFCRWDIMKLAFLFLHHSNPDISVQKTQSLKQQALRLLLWLSTQGLALSVFCAVTEKLSKGSTDIDSTLIRYFVLGIVEIVRPPFSVPYVSCFGNLLLTKPCVESLQSEYFAPAQKALLAKMISAFSESMQPSKMVAEKDRSILNALVALYCSENLSRLS